MNQNKVRGRTDTSGPGQETVPTLPAQNDKFKDLIRLVVEPINRKLGPASFERVVVKSDVDEMEPNPTLSELLELKIR